jgi:non-homologous end joining protein Ku
MACFAKKGTVSSPDFESERYADEYRELALAMIEKKAADEPS